MQEPATSDGSTLDKLGKSCSTWEPPLHTPAPAAMRPPRKREEGLSASTIATTAAATPATAAAATSPATGCDATAAYITHPLQLPSSPMSKFTTANRNKQRPLSTHSARPCRPQSMRPRGCPRGSPTKSRRPMAAEEIERRLNWAEQEQRANEAGSPIARIDGRSSTGHLRRHGENVRDLAIGGAA